MQNGPLKDFGMITEKDYLGKTFEDAKILAESRGFTTRLVERDGDSFILTMDFHGDRINFRTNNNIVIGAHGG